jgi:thiol-disulfide isomerase/thioredoxin
MRKVLALLSDPASGVLLAGVLLFGLVVLLQSRSLVYLLLPSLGLAALLLGVWRGRSSALPAWLVVSLLNLPLLLLTWYTAGRAWTLMAVPVLSLAFAAVGVGAARRPAAGPRWRVTLPLLAGATLLLGALGAMGPRFARSLVASSEVREPAVPFQFVLPAGGAVSAAQLRGRVAVIDFWATWCVPCQHELPELERLYRRFAADRRVVFYAVDEPRGDSPELQGDTPARAVEFFRKRGYLIPLALDAEARAAKALRAHGLPTLLVLDRSGRVRLRHVGYVGSEDLGKALAETIERLLAESPA